MNSSDIKTAKKLKMFADDARAMELRATGLSLAEVAEKMGWSHPQTACSRINRAMRRYQGEPVEAMRSMMNQRYNLLLEAWLPKALGTKDQEAIRANYKRGIKGRRFVAGKPPDANAVDRVLKILEAQAKLNGLDKPPTEAVADLNAAIQERIDQVYGNVIDVTPIQPPFEPGLGMGSSFAPIEVKAIEGPAETSNMSAWLDSLNKGDAQGAS